ncbi:MAG TPA: TRAP transporter large permease subunit [Usitatibacter sp.]|nr:TRAP transporter large permease subunit [Usitatibacter sp.]
METGGLWMLAAVGLAMLATGLPAWIVLVGVSLAFTAGGIAAGALDASLFAAIPGRIVGLLENDLLQALPLYVLMGVLINRTPLADTLFRAARAALRSTGRAVPLAGIALAVLLAPMSGSVGASVAMLSRTLHPRLAAEGMAEERNVALVCVASTLGVVVPPSLVLILLGDAMMRAHTEASHTGAFAGRILNTQDVFHAALVPAAVFLLLCIAITAWQSRRTPREERATPPARVEWITAIAAAALIVGLLAGVALGYLYAVEAAAAGGLALAIHALATGALRGGVLGTVLRETLALSGSLFALLVAATVFTLVQRAFGTDRWLAGVFASTGSAAAALGTGLATIALCALVLDAFEMIFVVVPLVAPALLARVPDAPWVAVLVLLILQASFVIPPFGYAVMMARSRIGSAVGTRALARALLPFVAAQLAVLALVAAFPAMLWRDPAPAATDAPAKGDEDALRRMLEQRDEEQAPEK